MIVKVPAKELKRALSDMAPLFKASEQFRAFNLSLVNSTLYLNANTGIRYETAIALTENYPKFEINLIYQDISEILGEKGTVELELSPASCVVRTGVFDITLTLANDSVTPLFHQKECEDSLPNFFEFVCKTLMNTQTFRKALKITPILSFNGETSHVKFPTVWIETMGGYLHCNLTADIVDIIITFSPTSFCEQEDRVIFYNSSSTLIVPSAPPSENTFSKMCSGMQEICEIDVSYILPALKKVSKVFGNGGCTLFFSPMGIKMQLFRPTVHSLLTFGTPDTIVASAQLPLEFVQAAFAIINGPAKILYGGGKLCVQSSTTRILLSVSN